MFIYFKENLHQDLFYFYNNIFFSENKNMFLLKHKHSITGEVQCLYLLHASPDCTDQAWFVLVSVGGVQGFSTSLSQWSEELRAERAQRLIQFK